MDYIMEWPVCMDVKETIWEREREGVEVRRKNNLNKLVLVQLVNTKSTKYIHCVVFQGVERMDPKC
jgi:hypothetical protein